MAGQRFRIVESDSGAVRGQQVTEAAHRVLEVVLGEGASDRGDIVLLADEVLGRPLVRAALQVKAGSPTATVAPGELAAAVVVRESEEERHG